MEKELLNAVEDLSLIKTVIEKTRKSFVGSSVVFIKWGVLFTIYSILTFMQTMNMDKTMQFYDHYPFLLFALPLVIVAIAFLLYKQTANKSELFGLEKQILLIWVLLIFMGSLPTKINIIDSGLEMTNIQISTNNISTVAFGLGIAMIMTALFTEYRLIKLIGIIYIVGASILAFTNILMMSETETFISYALVPFSLLFTGFYLKKQGAKDGYQLDS